MWYICEDSDFHIKTGSLQDLSVNFKIYLKRTEIKVLMTIISKAIDCMWSLLFVGLQNVALVSVKSLIFWMLLKIICKKIVAGCTNTFR